VVHIKNAALPILVNDSGNVTEVKPQP
jgi:hypothetical protein